jgi:hypothetical protein
MPFTPTKYKRGPQHAETFPPPPGTADTLLKQVCSLHLLVAGTGRKRLCLSAKRSSPHYPSSRLKHQTASLLSIRMHHLPVNQVHAPGLGAIPKANAPGDPLSHVTRYFTSVISCSSAFGIRGRLPCSTEAVPLRNILSAALSSAHYRCHH